jgi:hypothetical protein
MATLLGLGVAAMAAETKERPPCVQLGILPASILELQPGMTKIVKPCRSVQAIAIGNPNIADASPIDLYAIAITGKGVGLTNFILFDEEGKEISNTRIQVVGADVYSDRDYVKARREIRVFSTWGGPSHPDQTPDDRRYLCAQNCSAIQVEKPIELNPLGNTSAPVGPTSTQKIISTSTVPSPTPLPH